MCRANVCADKLCCDVSVRPLGSVCVYVELSLAFTILQWETIVGDVSLTCWRPFYWLESFCSLIIAPHGPSSTLLVLTVGFSVANSDRRGNLNPPQSVFMSQSAPCFPPLAATEHLWRPSGCGGKGCRCCQMPRSFRVVRSSHFFEPVEAALERVTEPREQWTSDPSCHPSSSEHWAQSWRAAAFSQGDTTRHGSGSPMVPLRAAWRGKCCLCGVWLE